MWRQKCDVCDVGRVTFVTSLCESKLFLRRSRSSIREMGRPVNRRQIRFVKSHFFRATSSNIFLTILGKNQLAGKFWKSIYKIFWTFSQILKKYFWKEKNCRVRVNQHFSENFFWVSILVPNKIKFDRMEKIIVRICDRWIHGETWTNFFRRTRIDRMAFGQPEHTCLNIQNVPLL